MEYLSEIISFIVGMAGGSFLTLKLSKKQISGAGKLQIRNLPKLVATLSDETKQLVKPPTANDRR